MGILKRDPAEKMVNTIADAWNAGRANDFIDDGGGVSFTVAADNGGIWRVTSGQPSLAVSDSWTKAHFRTLAVGPDGAGTNHVYAGGEGLFETDVSNPLPFLNWHEITSLSNTFPNSGSILRILVLSEVRIIVVACVGGLFFSPIPAAPQRSGCLGGILGFPNRPWTDAYNWKQAVSAGGIISGGFHDVALGPKQTQSQGLEGFSQLIIGGLGAGTGDSSAFKNFTDGPGPGGLFVGQWVNPGQLIIRQSTVTHNNVDITGSGNFGNCSVASFENDPRRAYALSALPLLTASHNLFGVLRSFDGGASWQLLDAQVEKLDSPGVFTQLTDEPRDDNSLEVSRTQATYNQSVAVSPVDPDLIAIGMVRSYISWNAGDTWLMPSVNIQGDLSVHAHEDVHRIKFPSATFFGPNKSFSGVSQSVYCASDGGLAEIRWSSQPCVIATDYSKDSIGIFDPSIPHPALVGVVLEDNDLAFYARNSNDLRHWNRSSVVTSHATGPGCIIQSDFVSTDDKDKHRNFEVVVLEGSNLVHYWGAFIGGQLNWYNAGIVTSNASGPGWLIQSSYRDGDHGHFEVVVREGNDLVHYTKNNSNPHNPWGKTGIITHNAIGPGCIIQGSFPGNQADPNFEVVVLEHSGIQHYFRDNSGSPWPWIGPTPITQEATGPASFIQGDFFTGDAQLSNFELVVPQGNKLFHWVRDNGAPGLPWRRDPEPITDVSQKASGPACIIQSNFGTPGPHGNFEVLACEGGKVVHYWRDNAQSDFPWHRTVQLTPCAFTYRSEMNSTLATLEFNNRVGAVAISPGYGTLGVSSAVPGLIAGGTQDNGIVSAALRESQDVPWFTTGGDGAAAMFLPFAGSLDIGSTFVGYTVDLDSISDRGAPFSMAWDGESFGKSFVIPVTTPNPDNASSPKLGLITPIIESVIAPASINPGAVLGLGAKGADIFALVLTAIPAALSASTGPKVPLGWVFQQTLGPWRKDVTGDTRSVTALAPRDGQVILLGALSVKDGTAPDSRIFSLNLASPGATPVSLLSTGSQINAFASAIGIGLDVAVCVDGNVFLSMGSGWRASATQPSMNSLIGVAIDPETIPATIFVATTTDVFISADLGKNWVSAKVGLPAGIRCSDIRYLSTSTRKELFLSSYGRSVWVAPKRQLWVRP